MPWHESDVPSPPSEWPPLLRTLWCYPAPRDASDASQRIQDQAHEVRRAGGDVTAFIVGELERLSYPDGTPAERDWARRVLSQHWRGESG